VGTEVRSVVDRAGSKERGVTIISREGSLGVIEIIYSLSSFCFFLRYWNLNSGTSP
jgi:hypothetical protein